MGSCSDDLHYVQSNCHTEKLKVQVKSDLASISYLDPFGSTEQTFYIHILYVTVVKIAMINR